MSGWRRWIAPGLALALALVVIASFDAAPGSFRIYRPLGYVAEVDRLIAEGKLRYDCSSEEIEPAELTPAERYFVDNSYLLRDLGAWRRGDRRPFLVERRELGGGRCEGRLLGANASFHNQRLPTYVADTWLGSLYLRPGAGSTALTSAERTLEVVPVPWRQLPLEAGVFEDVWFGTGAAGVRSPKLAFKMFERARAFATLEMVGDDPVLEVQSERPALLLDGCPLPQGWWVRLDDGDALRVHHPGRLDEHYALESERGTAPVSFVSEVNGEWRRTTRGDRLEMARDVAWAIDAAVDAGRELEGAPGRDDFDVYLTLDPFLHGRLDAVLADFCRARYGRRPLRAAVSVLEAGSGRLLALASYPGADRAQELAPGSPADRQLLARNHNFLQHPVGSAAKPFLAAAALATRPQLASLELPCFAGGEAPSSLLGYDLGTYHLPGDCGGSGEDGRVDFADFLRVSSNRYMLFLGLLAMADWEGGAPVPDRGAPPLPELDRYRLGGRAQTARPRLPIVREEAGDGLTELKEVAEQAYVRRFRDLFEQGVIYRRGSVAERLDLGLWGPVVDVTVGDPSHPAVLAFSEIAPEEVNLRANLVQQLRQDLYTLLLGAGNNRWSNPQLAEALARLVTGRAVRARLVERVAAPAEGGAPEVLYDLERELAGRPPGEWPLAEADRRRLVEAMAGVVEDPGGTAHALAPVVAALGRAAPEGVRYRALAKTGTPTSDLATVRRGPTDPAPGAVQTFSGRRQVESAVLVLAVERQAAGETEHLALALHVEAQGGSEEAVSLAAQLLRPLVEAHWPQDWIGEGSR